MADRVLFIGWSHPVRGREEIALEAFNEAIGLYGRLQQEGRIESFDVVLLDPQSQLRGYMELRGSAEQLAAVHEDREFRRIMTTGDVLVDGLTINDGYTGQALAGEIEMYREVIAKAPQAQAIA